MTIKNKRNVDSELRSTSFQHQADETSKRQPPGPEEIRRRAYEIYLERDSRSGDELDDWLRAERELEKVALFARDWNRLQQTVAQTPKTEIDIRPMETKEREANDDTRDFRRRVGRSSRSGRGHVHRPIAQKQGTDPTWRGQKTPLVVVRE
jgi:hypothetical protein